MFPKNIFRSETFFLFFYFFFLKNKFTIHNYNNRNPYSNLPMSFAYSNNSEDFVIIDEVIEEQPIVPPKGETNASSESLDCEKKSTGKDSLQEKALDLVFLMDCTGSMGQYIASAKENIESISNRIIQTESCDVRFGLVAYRDHPPQDTSYVTQVFEFVSSNHEMSQNLSTLSADGGGDGPEALTAGLHAAKNLSWRKDAAKVVVLIADAPPHGLGERGDGFPEGDPDGLDPLVIAREMSNLGIAIYAVGCEPSLSSYSFAKPFLISLSELTGGKAVCLSSASLLADVILGGAVEELNIQMLSNQLKSEIDSIREEVRFGARSTSAAAPSEEVENKAVSERLHERLIARGVQIAEMRTDGEMKDFTLSPQITACAFLSDVRRLVSEAPPTPDGFRFGTGFGSSFGTRFSSEPPISSCFGSVCEAPPARSVFGVAFGAMHPTVSMDARTKFSFGGGFSSASPAMPVSSFGSVPFGAATSATTCAVVHDSPSFSSVSKMVSKASRR